MTEDYEFEYNALWDEFRAYEVEYDIWGMKHRRLIATGDRAKEMRDRMKDRKVWE